jgi:hypothetical protein
VGQADTPVFPVIADSVEHQDFLVRLALTEHWARLVTQDFLALAVTLGPAAPGTLVSAATLAITVRLATADSQDKVDTPASAELLARPE